MERNGDRREQMVDGGPSSGWASVRRHDPVRERGHGDACYRLLLEVPHKLNAKQREALEAYEEASKEHGPLATSFLERMKKLLG